MDRLIALVLYLALQFGIIPRAGSGRGLFVLGALVWVLTTVAVMTHRLQWTLLVVGVLCVAHLYVRWQKLKRARAIYASVEYTQLTAVWARKTAAIRKLVVVYANDDEPWAPILPPAARVVTADVAVAETVLAELERTPTVRVALIGDARVLRALTVLGARPEWTTHIQPRLAFVICMGECDDLVVAAVPSGVPIGLVVSDSRRLWSTMLTENARRAPAAAITLLPCLPLTSTGYITVPDALKFMTYMINTVYEKM